VAITSFFIHSFIHSFTRACSPGWSFGLPFRGFLITHIQTHCRTPLDEWSARRRGLYLHRTTQYINTTNIHSPSGIRTRDPSNQAAADLRLRPRGHWNRHFILYPPPFFFYSLYFFPATVISFYFFFFLYYSASVVKWLSPLLLIRERSRSVSGPEAGYAEDFCGFPKNEYLQGNTKLVICITPQSLYPNLSNPFFTNYFSLL
jgi:hypothetical protein